jgi:hypothetical protein
LNKRLVASAASSLFLLFGDRHLAGATIEGRIWALFPRDFEGLVVTFL